MKRILVGMDGSPGAATAAAWSGAIAADQGAELVLATVIPPERQEGWTPPAVPSLPPGLPVRRLVLGGEPRAALAAAANAEAADLLVAGSSGVHWYPALHLDHVAHHLAYHATQPVAIVPPDVEARPVSTVVVGVNGSPGSKAAVRWLAGAAFGLGREVVAVHAVMAPLPTRVGRVWAEANEEDLRLWSEPLRRRGIDPEIRLYHGDPVTALCSEANVVPASVIVFGGRPVDDHHPLGVGATGLRLLSRTRQPVILVPPAT